MDIRLEDGTIVKNVPAGTTKAQLMAKLGRSKPASDDNARLMETIQRSKGPGAVESLVRGAAQGATFNLADEFAAGMDALTQPIIGRGSGAPSIGSRYEANLANERGIDAAAMANSPVSTLAGNVAGAVLGPGKFLKQAKTTPAMIKQGATQGAIYGFGAGEGGPLERAQSAGLGGALGAGTGAVLGTATSLFNKVRPQNLKANAVNKAYLTPQDKNFVGPAAQTPVAADSARIAQEIGQTYTPGQATGSRSMLTMEGLVRRHPSSAAKMQAFDEKQLEVSLRNLNANLDKLAANPAGPEATGSLVSKAFDKVLNTATTLRRKTATADFGRVDELAGRFRVIKPDNLKAEIASIAKDFDVPGGGDASAALVNRIQGIAKDLDRAGPQGLNARETQRLLEVYGDAQRGTGKIFADLDTAQQRMIAGRLKDAVLRDIDTAADQGGHVAEVAEALKTARNNYKANSQSINEMEKSTLGRLFGGDYEKSPERIAQTIRNMPPSELRQSMDILNKADPATSQSVKRFLVEDALATAGYAPRGLAPQAQIAGEDVFSPAKFLTAIRKSPVWAGFDATERKGMETAVRDLERVAFRAGTDGSPTAPMLFGWEVAKALGGGAAALSPTQIAKSVAAVMVPQKIAAAITTPQGQQALRTINTAKPNSAAARAATASLVALFAPTDAPPETEAAP